VKNLKTKVAVQEKPFSSPNTPKLLRFRNRKSAMRQIYERTNSEDPGKKTPPSIF